MGIVPTDMASIELWDHGYLNPVGAIKKSEQLRNFNQSSSAVFTSEIIIFSGSWTQDQYKVPLENLMY